MLKKHNIAIAMGGYSSEREISLKSGQVVYSHLDPSKYKRFRIYILPDRWVYVDENSREYPVHRHDFSISVEGEKIRFDTVFIVVHGTPGEDGYLQGYLDILNIPHTSCGMYQAALTFNKRDLLAVLKSYGIKCATSYPLDKGCIIDNRSIIDKVGLPCFVKANRAGSSYGVSKVYKEEQLASAIANSFKEDDEIIIESFLDGVEVSVGVIDYKEKVMALPVTEIVSENDFFDYEAKYMGRSEEITPARISEEMTKRVQREAERIYKILKLQGFSRSEFIFQGEELYLLEVNTVPGLTEESILPQQAAAAGISLEELFDNAVQQALGKERPLGDGNAS